MSSQPFFSNVRTEPQLPGYLTTTFPKVSCPKIQHYYHLSQEAETLSASKFNCVVIEKRTELSLNITKYQPHQTHGQWRDELLHPPMFECSLPVLRLLWYRGHDQGRGNLLGTMFIGRRHVIRPRILLLNVLNLHDIFFSIFILVYVETVPGLEFGPFAL